MLLTLSDILSTEETSRLRSILMTGENISAQESLVIKNSLLSHPLFLIAVQPRIFSEPVFRRYDKGMELSYTTDEAIIGGNDGIRADVSVIIFLTDLSTYDGGGLIVDYGYGDEIFKVEAGHCAIFSASVRYGIKSVTKGTCMTAQLWVQSQVKTPAKREILYDIGYSLYLLEVFGPQQVEEIQRLQQCQKNLLRLWAEI